MFENKFLKKIKEDFEFRTIVFSFFSLFLNVVFMFYNFFLGTTLNASWNLSVGAYFAILATLRLYLIFSELKNRKLVNLEREKRQKSTYLIQSILLLVIDISLIGPISLMVIQKRIINYSEISAIALAAYTTIKIFTSTKSFFKTRKNPKISIKAFKSINFVDALVSILTLQYALIMTFSSEGGSDMLPLSAISSFVIWLFLIIFSAGSLIKAIKINRAKE